jgi:hypothetical protein
MAVLHKRNVAVTSGLHAPINLMGTRTSTMMVVSAMMVLEENLVLSIQSGCTVSSNARLKATEAESRMGTKR